MVQQLYDNYVFIYGMAGLCALGILLKILVSRTYKRLIKASDNMGSTKHKLMKLMKMKFEACYKLKIGVNNVDSFVDKYVYKHKVCGIHLYTWENIGGQLLVLCLLAGSVGSVLGLAYNCGKNDILVTFFTGVFTSSLLIVVESFINLGAKKSILKANITDYLENFLKVRLEQENFTPEVLEEYRQEYFRATADTKKNKKKSTKVEEPIEDKYEKTRRMVEQLKAEEEELKCARQKELKDRPQESQRVGIQQGAKPVVNEETKTKRDRDREMLLREKSRNYADLKQQQNKLEFNKPVTEKVAKNKVEDTKSAIITEVTNKVEDSKPKLQPTYPISEDNDEDMRFLIKSLMDTAASKEEVQAQMASPVTAQPQTSIKEVRREGRTESEEKIIEDILKEFLA